jgi:fructose transport system permease protein
MSQSATAVESAPQEPFRSRRNLLQELLHAHPTLGSLIVLVAAAAIFGLVNHRFLAPVNLSIMLQQVAVIGSLSLGQTVIILTAGIDLSVGAAMILAQLIMAELVVSWGVPAPAAILAGFAAGAATGVLNGALVTLVSLPPFIVTLGTLSIFDALGILISGGQTYSAAPGSLLAWTGTVVSIGSFQITTGVLLMLAMYLIAGFMLSKTAWGRHVYAVGDDLEASRLAGVRTGRVLFSVYVLAGLIYGLAGWIQVGRVGGASTNISTTLNLDSITAVVIGGTSLFGGRGVVLGTLFGALIVEAFQNGLSLAGVQDLYQLMAEGILVLAAVGVDQWIRRVRR